MEGIKQIRDWRIDEKLGEGSFGVVVRGINMQTGKASLDCLSPHQLSLFRVFFPFLFFFHLDR